MNIQLWARMLLMGILLGILYLVFVEPQPVAERSYPISYSEFKSLLDQGRIEKVLLVADTASGQLFDAVPLGPQGQTGSRFTTRIPALGDEALLPALEAKGVEIEVGEERKGVLGPALLSLLPWVLFIALWWWLLQRASRNLGGGLGRGGALQDFLRPPTRKATIPDVTFNDVAGQENVKREVSELVDFLRDPQDYLKLGAEVPRGVLLMGPPGTGKTLMARALAGEAGVPFYTISASEFIEVFVGVGAARVRNLFQEAKKNAPSIIFIDELDSVGRTRGTGLGGGHDEREQTLNQILAEMDGFEGHEAVIVLAATNRPDVLDPALLRPGRFDRHVTLDLPDRKDRVAILKVHTRKVPLAEDVDFEQIASGTPGFSGADIKNLVNEAAMLAARMKSAQVNMAHFDEARDKLLLGTVRTLAIQPQERHRLAVHEAGHTLVAYFLPHADPLYKVTIIPRGHALGGTHQLPEEERHTLPEDYLRDRLAVTLGGRSAEKELLGSVSSGADDDIRQVTALARAMVGRWGMSSDIGPVDLRDSEEHPFLGREIAQPRRFSEASAQAVDQAVRGLLHDAEEQALAVIRGHRQALERLIALLEERETLHREQIEQCLGPAVRKTSIEVVPR
ncbi:MAG: ATP-dependent zinc metalloprotease FtsH [Gammaproteobacteria bacterium]|nr:MAG: ATP-dependent zinc metalloprotease FtsH [Gammaproteobacteria bacterium]